MSWNNLLRQSTEAHEAGDPGDLLLTTALTLAPRLELELGYLLEEVTKCENGVRRLLAADPQPERKAYFVSWRRLVGHQ
jgi:hypothetical protein